MLFFLFLEKNKGTMFTIGVLWLHIEYEALTVWEGGFINEAIC